MRPSITDDMIERGAKALWEWDDEQFKGLILSLGPWEAAAEDCKEIYREKAHAVLEAALGGEQCEGVHEGRS